MSRCTDTTQSTSHIFPPLPVSMGHHVEVHAMNFAPHEWKGRWMSSNTHPSSMGAKYKKAQLEQERAHGAKKIEIKGQYQQRRNKKPNWNFEESSILPKKKCNKSLAEAKNNTHPHTYMKSTVTEVLYKHTSVVHTSSCLP